MRQIGLHAQGKKSKVLKELADQAMEQKAKYGKERAETQIPLYGPEGPLTETSIINGKPVITVKHKSAPQPNETGDVVIDAALANIVEQLSHAPDDEEVGVSFQITIHVSAPA